MEQKLPWSPGEPIYDDKEIRKIYKISRSTQQRWKKAGILPKGTRLGAKNYTTASQLSSVMEG